MAIVLCGSRSFPRDLDVQVTVTKTASETLTDLSVLCCATTDEIFYPDARRVQFYNTLEEVEGSGAVPPTSQAWAMAQAFFAQSPRARTMAIGRVYTAPTSGFIQGSTGGGMVALKAVTDGSFSVKVDGGAAKSITALDLSTAITFADVATVINAALATSTAGATIAYTGGVWQLTSTTTGATSTIAPIEAVSPATGTFLGSKALLALDASSYAQAFAGYVPAGIASELALIQQAAGCAGKPIYAWALSADQRTADIQTAASGWVQGRKNWLVLTSNDATAYNAAVTDDIGSVLQTAGNYRTGLFWSNQVSQYPDVALAAYMLSVNYAERDSVVTAKFKALSGISVVGIDSTQLATLEHKGYNVLTKVGNDARTVREGAEVQPTWFIDDLLNLDNLAEQVQAAVYNVFLRNKKVPYTDAGAKLIYQAIDQIGALFVLNGTLAARTEANASAAEGYVLLPAYTIDYTPLYLLPVAQRAQRVGPPFTLTANLAGAIHSVAININAQV